MSAVVLRLLMGLLLGIIAGRHSISISLLSAKELHTLCMGISAERATRLSVEALPRFRHSIMKGLV
jgi:hypothetical protein